MEKEFNLSEKKRIPFDCIPDRKSFYFYSEEDVKLFIKKLKDKIRETPNISKFDLRAEIDKLAGRKLVEGDRE